MTKWKNKAKDLLERAHSPKSWMVISAIVLSGFMAFYWDMTADREPKGELNQSEELASTFIPAGYVLVPIEVANFEALDSILGQFGIVDLYARSESRKNSNYCTRR
jgi:hypothetical protein